jgi:hypothetical protein
MTVIPIEHGSIFFKAFKSKNKGWYTSKKSCDSIFDIITDSILDINSKKLKK